MAKGKVSLRLLFVCLVSLLFLYPYSRLLADNTFPYSYSIYQTHSGGRLLAFEFENHFLSFFVKPTLGDFAESVFFWKGLRRDSVIGVPNLPPTIVSSKRFADKVVLLSYESPRLFISILDTNLEVVSIRELTSDEGFYSIENVRWLDENRDGELLLLVNYNLYHISIQANRVETNFISKSVLDGCLVNNYGVKYVFVRYEESYGFVQVVDTMGREKFLCRIDISNKIKVQNFGKQIVAIAEFYNSSLFQVAEFGIGIVNKFWLETKLNNIFIVSKGQKNIIYYLRNVESGYKIFVTEFEKFNRKLSESIFDVPNELSEPYGLFYENGRFFGIFRNGLVVYNQQGELEAFDFITLGEYFPQEFEFYRISDYFVLSSTNFSLVLKETRNSFWLFSRFYKNFGKILIPLVFSIVLFLILRVYFKQRRLLKAIIEAPTTGVVFIVDKFGRLIAANNSGKELLAITESVPMKRLFSFYCRAEYLHKLEPLVEKAILRRDSFIQKVNFIKNKNEYEWLFTVLALRNFMGKFRGAILTGTDITEVLGRQKLVNLSQLAHDMQTNLSTIRLNAEQFETDANPKNEERKRKIIHQVGLLIQRVRDIVTVGRGELYMQEVDAYDLCWEARMEFDEVMFPNVEFETDLEHFTLQCDRLKMIRAIRNAIENAIKAFQGKKGLITISNWKDTRWAYFSIKDNGPGMDKSMIDKILKPYFTTGGSGIGTMIMQHVVELHGGKMEVRTEKGKGTEIVFIIPIVVRQRHKSEKRTPDKIA